MDQTVLCSCTSTSRILMHKGNGLSIRPVPNGVDIVLFSQCHSVRLYLGGAQPSRGLYLPTVPTLPSRSGGGWGSALTPLI